MQSEVQSLQTLFTLLAIAFIVGFTYLIRRVPYWIEVYVTDRQKIKTQQELDALEADRDQRAQLRRLVDTVADRDKDDRKFQDALITYLGRDVEERAKYTAAQEQLARTVSANTRVATDGFEVVSELKRSVEDLTDTTDKRLREIQSNIEQVRHDMSTATLAQAEAVDKITQIHTRVVEVEILKQTLDLMLSAAKQELSACTPG